MSSPDEKVERIYQMMKMTWTQGEEAERERIIKLLTAEMERIEQWTDYPATNALANIRAQLIKGEQK
jgi:hypothetical protein